MHVKALILAGGIVAVAVVTPAPDHPPERVAVAATPVTTPPQTTPDYTLDTIDHVLEWQRGVDVGRWVDEATPKPVVVVEHPAAPEPQPLPETPAAPGSAGDAIALHFGDMIGSATRVANCESSLDPTAVSPGGGNWGLFQINTVHTDSFTAVTGLPWSQVLVADANARFARWLYDQSGGWGPWACKWAA